ncbi:YqzK family protein [Paenibacillus filicis]|uniref:YqzK family protein n=1 Tax=Paenibacillus gyeongsangnamensis TaxID=3388067 RepID=A0ABT4Q829_9BACL|nr:YqzK family protein [Paenibacillus filicis]MCZ8512860.1 YqzK family protein [Paenibacillus filicis]
MVFHARKWMERFRFIVLFTAFTFLIYHALLLVTQWIEPAQKYKEPSGRAIKVFQPNEPFGLRDKASMGERLKLFYLIGE